MGLACGTEVVETGKDNDLRVISIADAGTYRTGQDVALQAQAAS